MPMEIGRSVRGRFGCARFQFAFHFSFLSLVLIIFMQALDSRGRTNKEGTRNPFNSIRLDRTGWIGWPITTTTNLVSPPCSQITPMSFAFQDNDDDEVGGQASSQASREVGRQASRQAARQPSSHAQKARTRTVRMTSERASGQATSQAGELGNRGDGKASRQENEQEGAQACRRMSRKGR